MLDTQALRNEHRAILALASRLGGVATDIRTRDDAGDAGALIRSIDDLLGQHLAKEGAQLYPALMVSGDEETRRLGSNAFEQMGGIVGAWNGYRDHWTVDAIFDNALRFALATEAVMGALSLRIEMENDVLYPAMERLIAGDGAAAA